MAEREGLFFLKIKPTIIVIWKSPKNVIIPNYWMHTSCHQCNNWRWLRANNIYVLIKWCDMILSTAVTESHHTVFIWKTFLLILWCNCHINRPITTTVNITVAGGATSANTQTETIMSCNHTIFILQAHTLIHYDQPHAADRERGSMIIIESDRKQYQMANQHSERLKCYRGNPAGHCCLHLCYIVY